MPASVSNASNRYLEAEFEDVRAREDFKRRQRVLNKGHNREDNEAAASSFCCLDAENGDAKANDIGSCLGLFAYTAFPLIANVDFLLGIAAKAFGWYDKCLGEMVCDYSGPACAVWIALTLCACVVFAFAMITRVAKALKEKCKNRIRQRQVTVI